MNQKKEKTLSLEKEINEAFQKYEDLFLAIKHSQEDVKQKIEEINALIQHVNGRIEYAESRITKMVTFSVALIGAGVALFGVITGLRGTLFCTGLISSGLLILTGFFAALLYVRQINPQYPFRGLKNDWKWFYPKIIDEKYAPNILVYDSKELLAEKKLLHVAGLTKYADLLIGEDPIERLKVDIQQLYLLHVNEKYKNTFLSHIRNVLKWGLILAVLSLIVLLTTITIQKVNPAQTQPISAKPRNVDNNKQPSYIAPLPDKPSEIRPNFEPVKRTGAGDVGQK